MAEKPCVTSWIKVKSRRFRNLLLKKSSSCKTSQSRSSFVLAELFSNFRLWSNWSWCCESPWQILWQREGGQGRRAFTFSRWQDLGLIFLLQSLFSATHASHWGVYFHRGVYFPQGCIFFTDWNNFSANRIWQCEQILRQEKGGGWPHSPGDKLLNLLPCTW